MFISTLTVCAVFAALAQAEDIKLTSGREYKGVKVSRVEPDGIVVITKTGISKLYFSEMPKELQDKYHYDPEKAAAYFASESAKQRVPTEQIQRSKSPAPAASVPPVSPQPGAADVSPAEVTGGRPPPPPSTRGIVLDRSWAGSMKGGSATINDLRRLLSPHARPAVNTSPYPEIELYRGISYLMPLRPSLEELGLSQSIPSRNKVICPGFPIDSLFYYAFDGSFEGDYNRIYVVTDRADQVVSVQLVCENPRRAKISHGQSDWTCYNFVNSRTKALTDLLIQHEVKVAQKGALLQIDTTLIETEKRKALETVRWYVPKPLVELILYCSAK